MNDAEYARLKDLIATYFAWWTRELGLGFWNVTATYYRHGLDGADRPDCTVMLDCACDWRYLTAHVRVNVHGIWNAEWDDETIERAVVHELCHALVNELGADVPTKRHESHHAHEERVVSMLANAFSWVRQHAEDPAPSAEKLPGLKQFEAGRVGVEEEPLKPDVTPEGDDAAA